MGGEWFVLVQVDGDFEQQSAEVTEASPFPLRSAVQNDREDRVLPGPYLSHRIVFRTHIF